MAARCAAIFFALRDETLHGIYRSVWSGERRKQNMRTPAWSVRMFFVKERRFGESIYEETGVAVACLRGFPLTSFPVTIGYFF